MKSMYGNMFEVVREDNIPIVSFDDIIEATQQLDYYVEGVIVESTLILEDTKNSFINKLRELWDKFVNFMRGAFKKMRDKWHEITMKISPGILAMKHLAKTISLDKIKEAINKLKNVDTSKYKIDNPALKETIENAEDLLEYQITILKPIPNSVNKYYSTLIDNFYATVDITSETVESLDRAIDRVRDEKKKLKAFSKKYIKLKGTKYYIVPGIMDAEYVEIGSLTADKLNDIFGVYESIKKEIHNLKELKISTVNSLKDANKLLRREGVLDASSDPNIAKKQLILAKELNNLEISAYTTATNNVVRSYKVAMKLILKLLFSIKSIYKVANNKVLLKLILKAINNNFNNDPDMMTTEKDELDAEIDQYIKDMNKHLDDKIKDLF